jgi:diguanylate cyclase (GGDEF)-like protein/PAS domain S-box-containing protein
VTTWADDGQEIELEGSGPSGRGAQDAGPSAAELHAATSWLSGHPGAVVGALGPDGVPVGLPSALALGSGHRVDDRSLLAIIAPDEASRVVAAFHAALERGVAAVNVRLADPQAGLATVHYFDLRAAHGVILRTVVPHHTAGETEVPVVDVAAARPRLAVVHKDERSRICNADAATSELLGWERDELIGRPTIELIHPDDQPRAIDNWMAFISTGSRHTVRLRYRTKAGEWLWMETSNELVADPTKQARHVVCQMIDISEEMAATEALRHNEELLRRLAETVPVGLAEIGADRTVLFSNQTFRALLGHGAIGSAEDLTATVGGPDADLLSATIDDCVRTGIDSEVDIRLAAGPTAPARVCRVALRSLVEGGRTRGALICVVDVTELKARAATDPLTGLGNRSSIFEVLDRALARGPTGVVFIDLDRFKPINDGWGHEVGDRVLARVADVLRTSVREGDTVGRVGGDEFVVVCPQVASTGPLLEIAARIKDAVAACEVAHRASPRVTASVGVAWVARASVSADEAVARADAAMYTAKRQRATGPVLWSAERPARADFAPGHV